MISNHELLDKALIVSGYKFLGWQNDWKHVYFDEDGNITTGENKKGEKPKRFFGYTENDYPEYCHCKESRHTIRNISHNLKGTENTYICDECRIFWKIDSGD